MAASWSYSYTTTPVIRMLTHLACNIITCFSVEVKLLQRLPSVFATVLKSTSLARVFRSCTPKQSDSALHFLTKSGTLCKNHIYADRGRRGRSRDFFPQSECTDPETWLSDPSQENPAGGLILLSTHEHYKTCCIGTTSCKARTWVPLYSTLLMACSRIAPEKNTEVSK